MATHALSKTEASEKTIEERLMHATFAGGCFWCMESPFDKMAGVIEVVSGYTGGTVKDPSYGEVSSGTTGHFESIDIIFDPEVVSYDDLLDKFWRQIDPTDAGGQFNDRGEQYSSAVFYHNNEQKKAAEASLKALEESCRFSEPIATRIIEATDFFPAEEYHQDYYKKNPIRYRYYRFGSGRDSFLKSVWEGSDRAAPVCSMKPNISKEKTQGSSLRDYSSYKKPSGAELRKTLTELQFEVTQESGTEQAFKNTYWDNEAQGIYVDIVSGEALFSSVDKYESGTGWPSFTRPLHTEYITEHEDNGFFTVRTELRSRYGNSHLGHLFTDGPKPAGLRYCINSAALRFIAREDLEKEGYERYKGIFLK